RFSARWMNPMWTNRFVTSRHSWWSLTTNGPKLAPQASSEGMSGWTGETPATAIAAKATTHARAITYVTITRGVAAFSWSWNEPSPDPGAGPASDPASVTAWSFASNTTPPPLD